MRPDLSLIICAYNEMGRIQETYEDLLELLRRRTEKIEILFFDNCSTDGTREWLKTITHPDVKVFFNERNLGKGASVRKGIGLSAGKYIAIYDADHEYHAADIWRCYDYAKNTRAAFVLGSRVLNGKGRQHNYLNYAGVVFLTSLLNVLYGCSLTDAATGVKLLEGDVIQKILLRCNGFDLDFELVARMARVGGKILEIPIDYYPRTVEEGKKLNPLRDGLSALRPIIKDRFASKRSLLKK